MEQVKFMVIDYVGQVVFMEVNVQEQEKVQEFTQIQAVKLVQEFTFRFIIIIYLMVIIIIIIVIMYLLIMKVEITFMIIMVLMVTLQINYLYRI